MIEYQIDITEVGYDSHYDETEDINELKKVIFPNGDFADCVGYIHTDADKDASLCVASLKEYGVFLGYQNDKASKYCLSLNDRSRLNEVADVWGDGLYVSIGLFISPELAWKGICEFAASGNLYEGIEWIDPNEVPEDGNYII